MSTSSTTRQHEFDFSEEGVRASGPIAGQAATASADIVRLPRFPTFTYPSSVETAASRMAGRLNAAAISPAEHRKLLDERQSLLDKELAGTISRHEMHRFNYVSWSLDRVDDAKYGLDLERLESMVAQYEQFQSDLEQFHAELLELKKSTRRR